MHNLSGPFPVQTNKFKFFYNLFLVVSECNQIQELVLKRNKNQK